MANQKPTRDEIIRQDIRDLHRLGYAQQLFREMGGFSNVRCGFDGRTRIRLSHSGRGSTSGRFGWAAGRGRG